MQFYPKYKSSGVEWIGEIPEHWEIKNLGYSSRMIVPMRDKPKELIGKIPWLRIEDFNGKYVSESKSDQGVTEEIVSEMNLKVFPVGTVLCSCSCAMGKTAIVQKPLITNQTFIGIVPNKKVNSDFLFYFMSASEQYLNSISTGAIQTYLSREDFEKLKITLPPEEEQTTIANYLDKKTTQINKLIANKQKLIELLKKERTAIISEAVSGKGKNWAKKKLKYVAKLKSGDGITADDIRPEGVYAVYGGNGLRGFTSTYTHEGNYVLIGRQGALCGNVNYATGKFFASEHAIVVSILDESIFIWLGELLKSMNLNQYSLASAQPGLSVERIQNLTIPFPSFKEQEKIVKDIRIETQRINNTISKIGKEIELMQEYRTVLISEVVTGKIKIIQ